MASPFQNAIAAAQKTRRTIAGVAATYKRGVNSVAITVAEGSSSMDLGDALLVGVGSKTVDFLIESSVLILATVFVTPQVGDLIIVAKGGETFTYAVAPVGSEPAWRYTDSNHAEIRVHTVLESRV